MNTELTNVINEPGAEQEYLGTNVPTIGQRRSRAESAICTELNRVDTNRRTRTGACTNASDRYD
jgi:hypothetical protein